jgi:hypothetical protein
LLPRLRQALECQRVLARETTSLALHPALELERLVQEEAVEERTGVERHRALERAGRDRPLEREDIGGNDRGIDAQPIAGAQHRAGAKGLTERVNRLVQQPASMLLVALGPEPGHQLVPAHRLGGRGGEERQERQTVALHHRGSHRFVPAGERHTTKELEGKQHEPR